jgi:hypothetical protein
MACCGFVMLLLLIVGPTTATLAGISATTGLPALTTGTTAAKAIPSGFPGGLAAAHLSPI